MEKEYIVLLCVLPKSNRQKYLTPIRSYDPQGRRGKKFIGFIFLSELYAASTFVVDDLEIFYYLIQCYMKKLLGSLLPSRY